MTAPEAKIMPLRVLDENGEGDLWRVTQAIIWAANNGADVINISFGYTTQPRLLKDLIADLDKTATTDKSKTFHELNGNQLVFIAGAGNGGQIGDGTLPIYPAGERISPQLGVAASTRYDNLADFSTFNRLEIKAAAPGENIFSALPGGLYGTWSGTSMSAPIASGIAALVKAQNPMLSPSSIVKQISATGIKWDCKLKSRDVILKTHRVDAFCAVTNNQACGGNPRACDE
jgi:subtilisin family serine protease